MHARLGPDAAIGLADNANHRIIEITRRRRVKCRRGTSILTERHEKVISKLVASGRYQNASEVLREGLRLIEERDSRDAAKLKILREAARAGFADFAAGRFLELEDDAIEEAIGDLGREVRRRDDGTQP